MLTNNFKRKIPNNKQRYLRYDDVFMSGSASRQENHLDQEDEDFRPSTRVGPQRPDQSYYQDNTNRQYNADRYQDDNASWREYDDRNYQPYRGESENHDYFSNRNSIVDEKMVRYQRRQLPQLQRYSANDHRDMYSEFNQSYWDDSDSRRNSRYRNSVQLGKIWQKFMITFLSIFSLVCISWIAYNWNGNSNRALAQGTGPAIIEPEQASFKALPENPGGEVIAYKDKTIYEKVDSGVSQLDVEERLLPPQDEPSALPTKPSMQAAAIPAVEEYSIIDEKTYYIKISAGKSRNILENEIKLLKKRHSDLLSGKNCAIKKVSNSSGEQKHAILIGPFDSQDGAVDVARDIGGQCYVISVKEQA